MYRNKDYLDAIISELESLSYVVEFKLLNAVNHGVPQNRERVIVVGHRGEFNYPTLQHPRITAGQALEHLAEQTQSDAKFLTASMDSYVAKYEKASSCITPRDLHLDRPARTVTCRNLAGATGDMHRVVLQDGRRRRLTVREGARLQSFPDWFEFQGRETNAYNQIGNAVPPMLAYSIAASFREYLESTLRLGKAAIQKRRHSVQLQLLAA